MNELIHEPNVVRIWNGTLIDVNKIVSISRPTLYRAYNSAMAKSNVSVVIYGDGNTPITITEYAFELSYDKRPYKFIDDFDLFEAHWKTVTGEWKANAIDDEIVFYADFKRKVDILVDYWTKSKEITDLFPING